MIIVVMLGVILFSIISVKRSELVDLGIQFAKPNKSDTTSIPPDYSFPDKSIGSSETLPGKVQNSFKSVIGITSRFIFDPNISYPFSPPNEPLDSGGTGFMIEPGLFITARHIFLAAMYDFRFRGAKFNIGINGLPTSSDYTYNFFATTESNNQKVTFPMELRGMGDITLFKDIAALKAEDFPKSLKPLELAEEARLNETVYMAGKIPIFVPPDNMGTLRNKILMDFLNYTFQGKIKAILTNMPANKAGTAKIYRIEGSLELGFSGGPIFNSEGKVVAITMSKSANFIYAVSATDIKNFITELKSKGALN